MTFSVVASCSIVPPVEATEVSGGGSSAARVPATASGSHPAPRSASLALTPSAERLEEYSANRPKSVIQLQQFRELTTIAASETEAIKASLVDLNPNVGTWYLLQLQSKDHEAASYHLESQPGVRLKLDPAYASGLTLERVAGATKQTTQCDLWSQTNAAVLGDARTSGLVYAPLCGGALYLRNPIDGHRTPKERVVDMLRDHVWQGEELTSFVKDMFYKDAFLATSNLNVARTAPSVSTVAGPLAPRVSPGALDKLVVPVNLEIPLTGETDGQVAVGRWYTTPDNPGIFVTTLRPDVVSPEVIAEQGSRVSALDSTEAGALAFLVAFDLKQFDMGFRVGTDHPRVDWSDAVQPAVRGNSTTGPDGIPGVQPLVRTGMLTPMEAIRVAATFTGGFKRTHGALRSSAEAATSNGAHYGFIENGVVLSKLQNGLATVVGLEDGSITLKTWTEEDNLTLPRVRYARQNGVPILERDASTGQGTPGSKVRDWGGGNWSGSADKKLRTLRAGLCMQENQGRQYLIYGYFSTATPSAMARIFQAAGCSYAMQLDMNALEHTYMAIYRPQGSTLVTEHLIDGMGAVDGSKGGQTLPRFVSVADNRDFFYLLRRTSR
ncbi:MAG: hypothetical protein ABI672_18890 [Vicinamibacteria bacterium]